MPRIRARTMRKIERSNAVTTDITIGCDPELFAFDAIGDVISVHDLLPGSKAMPLKIPKGAIQVDGIAAEFNIEPAKNRTEFMGNIAHVQNLLAKLLEGKNAELRLKPEPVAHIRPSYFSKLPESALSLGCEPDYNAYTGEVQEKPNGQVFFRTGSGHIHIGWTSDVDPLSADHFGRCCNLVKELDFVIFPQTKIWDKDKVRMSLYGKKGSFRPKSYGVEYRVPSNAWLRYSTTRMFMYDAAKATAEQFFKGFRRSTEFSGNPEELGNDYSQFLMKTGLPTMTNYAFDEK